MRVIASNWIVGPTSLSTRLLIGESASDAIPRPISPPIDVPTQSTLAAFRRASRVTMSAMYCATW